jgi:hypothetical protein
MQQTKFMQKLFIISFAIITIMTTSCFAEEVQNQSNLTGTVWRYTVMPGGLGASTSLFIEMKFISTTQFELWEQPVTGDKKQLETITYELNGNIITIKRVSDTTGTTVIDFQKNTITTTNPTGTFVFTKV